MVKLALILLASLLATQASAACLTAADLTSGISFTRANHRSGLAVTADDGAACQCLGIAIEARGDPTGRLVKPCGNRVRLANRLRQTSETQENGLKYVLGIVRFVD